MAIRYGSFQEMYHIMRNGAEEGNLEKAKKNSKGVKVRLIDAISEDQHFNLPIKNDKGQTVYRNITFEPGTLYKVPDETFLEALKVRGLTELKHSDGLENALKEAEVPYTIKRCKSCGGGLKKIKVQIFEVIGE